MQLSPFYPDPVSSRKSWIIRLLGSAAFFSLCVLILSGCEGGSGASGSGSPAAGASTDGAANSSASQPADANGGSIEEHYIIPPSVASAIDYRINWQTRNTPYQSSGVRQIVAEGDSVFMLDGQNFLARLNASDGAVRWRLAVAKAVDDIRGITYLPQRERVYLTMGGEMLVVDAVNGALVDKHQLDNIAGTAPVVAGPLMIYGSANGRVVWHAYGVGNNWKAYQISSAIRLKPVLAGGIVFAIGVDGRIAALLADQPQMVWTQRLLGAVEAAPAVGHGLLFVAGLDQHLWAFDANTGLRRWRYLTESPLRSSPVLIGERLYQQIPGEGLVAFDATVENTPGGKVEWTAADAGGDVIGEHGDLLYVWNSSGKTLAIVGRRRGGIVNTFSLPRVKHIAVSTTEEGPKDGIIWAASDAGEIIRLDPR